MVAVLMTDEPEVSVVIPTHNRWPFLSTGALPSALAQEQVRHEVIVVDDGSDDETAARVRCIDDSRLRLIEHERALGVAVARNSGIAAARGEWVAFLDDDDLWSPLKLQRQLSALRSRSAAFVYSDIVVLDERGDGKTYRLCAPEPEDLASKLLARYVIPGGLSNVVARTELVRSLGGFDHHLSMTADWDFLLRLARAGEGARCSGLLLATAVHAENMAIRSPWRELVRDLDYFVSKHRSKGLSIDESAYTRWLAVQRHRAGKTRDASLRLFQLSLRVRRPRYALEAFGWLRAPSGVGRSTTFGGDLVPEPSWLIKHRRGRPAARGGRARAALSAR